MTEHEVNGGPCVACGESMDVGIGLNSNRRPKIGDIAICGYCGHPQALAEEGGMRDLNDEEIEEVKRHPDVMEAAGELRTQINEALKDAPSKEEEEIASKAGKELCEEISVLFKKYHKRVKHPKAKATVATIGVMGAIASGCGIVHGAFTASTGRKTSKMEVYEGVMKNIDKTIRDAL